jgi:phytoene dehydrogenase-like protein
VPDAVVIGSGPNGLAAAFRLARAGRDVLVLEEAQHAGGAVHSAALTLPGFTHDVCAAVFPTSVASPAFAAMELERHGLRWTHPQVACAHRFEHGAAVLTRSLDETAAALDGLAPGEGATYRRLVRPLVEHWEQTRAVGLGSWPPLAETARLVAQLGPRTSLRTARLALTPITASPLGPHGQALLAGCGLHADLGPHERGSAVFALALCVLAHTVGWPSPEGGAGRLGSALAAAAEEAGASIATGTLVERIEVSGGRVSGVVAGGVFHRCREVVAATSPRELARLTGHGLPDRYRRRLERYRQADGAFKVDWALAGPVPWREEPCRRAGTVHVGGGVDALSRQLAARRRGDLPAAPFLLCGQQTLADPSRAPRGGHTLWAYGLVSPSARAPGAEVAERFQATIEAAAPGLGELVLGRAVHGPDDLERGNRNLVGGDVIGGACDLRQLVFRPVARAAPHRTPVRGLVLGSASTPPGGGVHGMCGWNAARALVDR